MLRAVRLTVHDHDRSVEGMTYVYPVVSRRAKGVSVGVNLNPNGACNWRCVYCQVPGLVKGGGPPIDLAVLEVELRAMLGRIVEGTFLVDRVPEGMRRLSDVAFSGNGEPTTSPQLAEAVQVVRRVLDSYGLVGSIGVVLITNGSRVEAPEVVAALGHLAEVGGEVWFKLDSATRDGLWRANSVKVDPERHLQRLRRAASHCPTWIQTCMFALDGAPPSEDECRAWIGAVQSVAEVIRGVHLYTIARDSHQPEAPRLAPVAQAWLRALASEVERAGVRVEVAP